MDKFSSLETPEIYLMIRKTEISKKFQKFQKVFENFSRIGKSGLKNGKSVFFEFLPVTICLWSGASKFCLKKKSPKARDIANAPFTLLNSTQPPPS